jgi:hypothetical protein
MDASVQSRATKVASAPMSRISFILGLAAGNSDFFHGLSPGEPSPVVVGLLANASPESADPRATQRLAGVGYDNEVVTIG